MDQTPDKPILILAIEDNPADVELLRMALDTAEFAYEMTVLSDGAEALAMFRQATGETVPDVVVLDLNLPKYGGLEILEAARANPYLAATPVAILSSSSSPRERSRIELFGFVTFITKPPDLDQYLNIGALIRDFVIESRQRCTSSGI
jgi:CheY-like chemotaxis protein